MPEVIMVVKTNITNSNLGHMPNTSNIWRTEFNKMLAVIKYNSKHMSMVDKSAKQQLKHETQFVMLKTKWFSQQF